MKNEMQKTKQRGRKPGDGILKELTPQDSYLEKAFKLAHGRTAGNSEAELVRTWRGIRQILSSPVNRKDKKTINSWVRSEYKKLAQMVIKSLMSDKSGWFRKMANAIDAEVAQGDRNTHSLHAAILALAQVPYDDGVVCGVDGAGTETAARVYYTNLPLETTPRHTIGEVCEILEKQGFKAQGQEKWVWRNHVRRACREVGLPLLPSKPGTKPKKS